MRSFRRAGVYIVGFTIIGVAMISCATSKKLSNLKSDAVSAGLSLTNEESNIPQVKSGTISRDTLKIEDEDGKEIFIMRAIKDEVGDMVAHEEITAAVVTARFRNVAERSGKVDLCFNVTVPELMRDSRWQLRFYPEMRMLDDSVGLEPVIITGQQYRKAQLRGYQQYERFLSTVVRDSTKFINLRDVDLFIKRNIPDLYAFKTDTSFVSNEEFISCYGVNERQVLEHYTNHSAKNRNERRIARSDMMYRKYVKAPIVSEGIRLDTIIRAESGDFIYSYTQTINTRPRLRKVDIILSGDIYETDKKIYDIPQSSPLTFYISTISSFVDNREKYMTKVIERRAEANTACYVEFAKGSTDIDITLGNNNDEIGRIKMNMIDLLDNKVYDLDSIIVVSYASPEGKVAYNNRISRQRSESISKYLNEFIKERMDSISREEGFRIDENGEIGHENTSSKKRISFISRSYGENWPMLDRLVELDTTLSGLQKFRYFDYVDIPDLDAREQMIRKENFYPYVATHLYPRLRIVKFNFNLHRKDMVKDTVHTTVLDSLYMSGVRALRDMDYKTALTILAPYKDYNTAVAYLGNDRNVSALELLQHMDSTPEVLYLSAIAYSRIGETDKAVENYLKACKANHQFVYRGNLDPEISMLIKEYGLNQEDEE